jgi:hypothetical protein
MYDDRFVNRFINCNGWDASSEIANQESIAASAVSAVNQLSAGGPIRVDDLIGNEPCLMNRVATGDRLGPSIVQQNGQRKIKMQLIKISNTKRVPGQPLAQYNISFDIKVTTLRRFTSQDPRKPAE